MANFAIMRCEKLKTRGNIGASLQHAFRERDTPNADPERSPENEHLVNTESTDQALQKLEELLPEKHRKDAVLCVEYVMTASPEWFENSDDGQSQELMARSMEWLTDKYGAENVIAAVVHKDEATPHLSAFVVPKTEDGRLSAKDFIGSREKLRDDQTTFAEKMQDLGLERGIEGSRATHERVKSHYAALNQEQKKPELTAEDLKPKVLDKSLFSKTVETPENVETRVNEQIRDELRPMAENAATASQERKRAKEMQKTLQRQQERMKAFQGLNPEQQKQLEQQAEKMQEQNRQQRERKRGPRNRARDRDKDGKSRDIER